MRRLAILVSGSDLGQSLRLLRSAVNLRPTDPTLHNDLGVTLERFGDYAEAAKCYRAAVNLKRDFHQVWTNLANALLHLSEPGEAEQAARRSIRLCSTYAPAHNALGCILLELGRYREAVESLRIATALNIEYVQAHANLGLTLLTLGDFENGWREHEWRRRSDPALSRPGKAWTGADPFGHTILLIAEGGLGNVIQFARYAKVLGKMGARVALECEPSLVPLLGTMTGFWRVVASDDPDRARKLAGCDLWCPLLSVPHILRTNLKTIPAEVPYLSPDAQRLARWESHLFGVTRFKVGIAWQAERRTRYGRQRTIPLEHYKVLAQIPGVHLVSLHKDWSGPAPFPVMVLPGLDEAAPFLDTAAVMKHLDLVITCDTSIAHLAGALGVPVWVALRFTPDWRWMLERDDSPWYPTMRLFRQRNAGDWTEVFTRMGECLTTLVQSVEGVA